MENESNEWTLEQRRSMVSQEVFNTFYSAGDPSTLSHEELDKMIIPRYKPTTVPQTTWWGGKMSGNVEDGMEDVIVDTRTTGETTIQFPKPHQPEQYNPNKPSLDTMTFKFEQESNCVDGGGIGEMLTVEAKSSLGIDGDGGAFYVLRTEQWAINDIDDMIETLKRVKQAVEATKPTTIHVK